MKTIVSVQTNFMNNHSRFYRKTLIVYNSIFLFTIVFLEQTFCHPARGVKAVKDTESHLKNCNFCCGMFSAAPCALERKLARCCFQTSEGEGSVERETREVF